MGIYAFLIPLLLGFALAGASAFTAAYSRRWGEQGGQLATIILRNVLGIPLWLVGFLLARRTPAQLLVLPSAAVRGIGWFLFAAGAVPLIWGHLLLGWRTHMPSVRDTLVRTGLYSRVRHPIYSGGRLMLGRLALVRPTPQVVVARAVAVGWVLIQARLEELDLVQRLPAYRDYMRQVPRFIPRLP